MRVAAAHGVTPEAFNGFDPAAFLPRRHRRGGARQPRRDGRLQPPQRQDPTGIWRDLAVRKRRTEVDAQLGSVVLGAAATACPPR